MSETKGTSWLMSLLKPEVLLVIGAQLVCGIVYVVVSLQSIKEIKATVDDIQKTQNTMTISLPLQQQSIAGLLDAQKDLRRDHEADLTRIGGLEQLTAGHTSEIRQLHDTFQTIFDGAQLRKLRQ